MRSAWGPLLAAALIAAPALAGCVPVPSPTPTVSAAATDAPVFASDAEALAAATKAYAAYLAASDQIAHEGGQDPERIAPFVSDALFASELEGFGGFQAAGARSVGSTTFRVSKIEFADYANAEQTRISLYVCEDVTHVDVVDSKGVSLVPPSRKPLTAFEVRLKLDANSSLVLDERTVWTGRSFC